jgi:methionine biosynthesis protein MetW
MTADSNLGVSLEIVPCGVCGSRRSRHLFDAHDYIYGNDGAWPVAQCENCGVVFMNPRIPPASIGAFYPQDYYASTQGIHDPDRLTWRRAAKDAAAEDYYGYKIPRHDPIHYRLMGWLMLPFTRRWTATRKYIYPVSGGRVLDVGCGNGQWLAEYKRLGWEAEGIEPSLTSAAIARQAGHRVITGELSEAQYPADHFDAVTLWDALEHIHNPGEIVREIYRITRLNGRVYISVPNFGSRYARQFKDQWFMFTAPLHYYHYTQDTLSRLLREAGFGSVQVSFPLGDVGLQPTLRAAWQHNKVLQGMLNVGGAKLLAGLDLFLPRGHLLAIGVKHVAGA